MQQDPSAKRAPLPRGVDPHQDFLERFTPGATPSPPDPRDRRVSVPGARGIYPRKGGVSYRPQVLNQWGKGACATFTALRGALHESQKLGLRLDPSEGFVYAALLERYGQLCQNVGAAPRDVYDTLRNTGVLEESAWPYVGDTSDLCRKPSAGERAEAAYLAQIEYVNLDESAGLDAVRMMISADHRVSICSTIYANWAPDPRNHYVIPLPSGQALGGHMYDIEDYDDDFDCGRYGQGAVRILNQWSEAWGDGGRAWVPYRHFTLPWEQGGIWPWDKWSVVTGFIDLRQAPIPEPEPEPVPTGRLRGSVRVWTSAAGVWSVQEVASWEAEVPAERWVDTEYTLPDGSKDTQPNYVWVP